MGIILGDPITGHVCFTDTYHDALTRAFQGFETRDRKWQISSFRLPDFLSIESVLQRAHCVPLIEIGIATPLWTSPMLFEAGVRAGLMRNILVSSEVVSRSFVIGFACAKFYVRKFAPHHRLAFANYDHRFLKRGADPITWIWDAQHVA
jgi:hypothetical protein